jgi:broad specificity phosphatase PhoE
MRIFLVRHAESKANALSIHGGKEAELSDEGVRQAEILAKRLTGMGIDLILCSRHKRAMQTAKIIEGTIGKKIIYTELLGEWRWPSERIGTGTEGDTDIWEKIYEKAEDRAWHYSDAESVSEVADRIKKVLKYIRSRKEETIVVVTHGAFMSLFLGLSLSDEGVTGKQLRKFTRFFRVINTGITELMMDDDGNIKLVTFNDYAHLQ